MTSTPAPDRCSPGGVLVRPGRYVPVVPLWTPSVFPHMGTTGLRSTEPRFLDRIGKVSGCQLAAAE